MSGSTTTAGGGINIASLMSALAPIFLGSGQTTKSQGPTTSTQTGSTTSSIDPATLAALTGIAGTATKNASSSTATDALVKNILTESAQAFTPVIAQQNSAGLYNTSTLARLSTEAQARATAAASQSVLNYQTSQQQIATGALTTIANNNKSTTSQSTGVQGPITSTQATAPSVPLSASLPALIGGVGLNYVGKSKTLESLLSGAGDQLSVGADALTDALGITTNASVPNALAAIGGQPLGVSPFGAISTDAAMAGGAGTPLSADLLAPASNAGLDISAAPGAAFDFGTAGADIGGAAGSSAAGSSAADIATGLGGAGAGAAEAGLDLGAAAGAGILFPTAEAAGASIAAGSSAATLAAGFASDAAIAGGAGAGLLGAGAAAGGAELGGAALAGEGAAGLGLLDFAPLLALVGWIVCTELLRQGKMPLFLYRYGYVHFQKYPTFGKYGYLLWARPVRYFLRKYPDSRYARIVATIFLLRVNNIAANAGCSRATWTWKGAAICTTTYGISWLLGVLLIPLRVTLLKSYFLPARVGA